MWAAIGILTFPAAAGVIALVIQFFMQYWDLLKRAEKNRARYLRKK